MPSAFHDHIQTALADANLQAALDANAERRYKARSEGYASLPEGYHTLRRRAHAVRARTIAGLDGYLEQFVERAQAHGMTIHRAADAAQAVAIVLEIARLKDARLVSKSKTMVGEEIGINRALEEAGLRVVETDLGEYIVQLRGERPAHIITPAVHLRRADVGRLFQEKLGLPYTEDVAVLTEAARRVLRQTFLDTDIGISGANFGVAETGALCLLTNEGNGRMVTTLPRVHIALMGIERLVPTLQDLALMLSLLPRSATGQKLTVYTNLIHRPKQPGDPDGPEERHVILIDNGRSALRRSPLAESLYCIRCGACLNACPVFREIGGHAYVSVKDEGTPYPGPIGSVISPGLLGQPEFGQLARASSLCGACKEACPVDIDLPKMLLRIRAGGLDRAPLGEVFPARGPVPKHVPAGMRWGLRMYSWLASNPRRFRAAQRLGSLGGRLLAPVSRWIRLPAFTGWGLSRDFPAPAARPFRDRYPVPGRSTGGPEVVSMGIRSGDGAAQASGPSHGASSFSSPAPSEITSPAPVPADLLSSFTQELCALGGQVTVSSRTELSGQVVSLLRDQGYSSVLAWEAGLPHSLLEEIQASGIQVNFNPDPNTPAGITGALAGVAETGTLVLPGGPGRMQSASLLPALHICILRATDLLPDISSALALPGLSENQAVTLVSGPSRTADIEMTLTIGVHGPRQVHVFCLEDE